MSEHSRSSPIPTPASKNAPFRVGILGCGRLAQNYYFPALSRLKRRLDICAADPLDTSRAATTAEFKGARTYADYQELLQTETLDAVLVATPPSTHLEIWNATGTRGMSVFMEKPFLLPGEMEQIDPTDIAWRNLMINFNRRFWPAYRSLGERVADDQLGQVTSARFTLNVDVSRWSTVSNHRADAREGGPLYDLGSQLLDLAHITFRRDPAEIFAQRSTGGGLEERVELALHYPDGFVVECDLAYGHRNRESVFIQGEAGVLRLLNPNFLTWLERKPSALGKLGKTAADFAALGYRGIFRSRSMLRYSVAASLSAFFEAIDSSCPFNPGIEDALRIAKWAQAAHESLQRGCAISLPPVERF